ncbi:jg25156 [Pararge aegeria aegeria]|uniref:Jg25156 protein n=1 Tax=Pararge aegeria aegeria TaxID=348720 RepID=A0A8S4RUQ0_9NEOP|nr:jg25156 [Pararge aegeria aegeria]
MGAPFRAGPVAMATLATWLIRHCCKPSMYATDRRRPQTATINKKLPRNEEVLILAKVQELLKPSEAALLPEFLRFRAVELVLDLIEDLCIACRNESVIAALKRIDRFK